MVRRFLPWLPAAMLVGSVTIAVASAHAQPADDAATKEQARTVGEEAFALWDRGAFADALDKFERADRIFPAPTFRLYAGKCLVQLNRWREAVERFRLAATMPLDPAASATFREAVQAAQRELDAISTRIPRLRVRFEGVSARDVQAILDGRAVPAKELEADIAIDPGAHHLVVTHGSTTVTRRFRASPQQLEEVVFRAPPPSEPQTPAPDDESSVQRTFAWVAFATAGVAGTAGGALSIASLVLDSKDACSGPEPCAPPDNGDVAPALRTAAMATFIGAAASLVVGTVLLLTDNETNVGITQRGLSWSF